MKKIYVLFLLIFSSLTIFSQNQFEGEISFVKTSYSDTLYYVYTIKDNRVRIDEYDKYKRIFRAYIVDLLNKSVLMINPNKQIYTNVESYAVSDKYIQNMEVINTGNHKYIKGFYCSQWRVKNFEENTEITYWVAGENFNFYNQMSQLAMSLEDHFLFFNALPQSKKNGTLPLLIESKTLLRAPKSTLTVTNIRIGSVDTSVFNISNYQKFENLR